MYSFASLEPVHCSMSSSNCWFLTCKQISQETGKLVWYTDSLRIVHNLMWSTQSNWRRKWQSTPVLLPGKSHGQRSLVGYSPWVRKESDMTERLHIHPVKCCGIVSKAEVYVFLDFSCFIYEPTNVGNWISCSSAFSQCSLNIWMFLVYVLLKLILENFQHYFCCVGNDPITIVISNQVPSHISLCLLYLIAKIDINSFV